MDVPFSCSCGAVEAVVKDVAPDKGTRVHCYCTDCQTSATVLGHADHLLDEKGGTEVYQLVPFRLTITAGAEHIALLRLSEKGLLRWYTSCCDTPIFTSSASPGVPIMGVVNLSRRATDQEAAIQAMGPSIGAFCPDEGWAKVDAPKVTLMRMIARALQRAAGPFFGGRLSRHPLFQPDQSPIAPARIATEAELGRADEQLAQKKAALSAISS